jgi:PTH1 family peptidyl-tRNA hydrolase
MTNKLIIGLGNPGKKYENTRHNVGFMVIDALASQIANSQWSMVKKYNSLIIDHQQSTIFCKPQTFMNSSGIAVSKPATFYKIPATNIYVIHDDLDIKLGEYKIQKSVGPRLHNGISSIEKALGTKDFWRVRIGVENRPSNLKFFNLIFRRRIPGEKYVLQNFNSREQEILNDVINNVVKELSSKVIK